MRVLVIGGSSSIGRKVVHAFAARGDDVIATYASTEVESPSGVKVARLDLEDPDSFADFVADVSGSLRAIDVLVFLSGIVPGKSLADYSRDLLETVVQVNFSGFALLMGRLLPVMAKESHVLVMSSISGERGSYDPIYAATKAALIGMVKSLAVWHGRDVRFNCVAPGLVDGSTMFHDMVTERIRHHRDQSPTGSLLSIEELAQMIVSLTEPQWRQLNGSVIRVNGGSYV